MRPAALPRVVVLIGLLAALPPDRPSALLAQCPDGTPPPCRGARRAAPHYDSSTALIVPLMTSGSDTALRRIGADLAAIIAENLTIGDVRAAPAPELRSLPDAGRAAAAARLRAGAMMDGSILRLGPQIRVTARLRAVPSGRDLLSVTVQGSPDSLLALADRVSVPVLKAWWVAQPGPYTRTGLMTDSLRALRYYISAMNQWRSGPLDWYVAMDSAARVDPSFLTAWIWLSIPPDFPGSMMFLGGNRRNTFIPGVVAPESADIRARALRSSDRGDIFLLGLPAPFAITDLIAGARNALLPEARAQCVSGSFSDRAESRYLLLRRFQLFLLAGCPDTMIIKDGRAAWRAAPGFLPTRRLLIGLLIDAGDTAGAREVIMAAPPLDTAMRTAAIRMLSARFGTGLDSGAILANMYGPWHRFRDLPDFSAAARHDAGPNDAPEQARVGLAIITLPALVATGRMDSARAVVRAIGTPFSAQRAMAFEMSFMLAPYLPIDSIQFGRIDSAALAPVIATQLQNVSTVGAQLGGRQAQASLTSMFVNVAVQAIFASGAIAAEHRDTATARWAAARLDTLAAFDSLGVMPRALMLRAEIALSEARPELAESLLIKALNISLLYTPERARWLLARRYAESGRPELALAMARSITVPTRRHGADHIAYYAGALKLEGEMLERLGRRTEAAERYRAYIALRSDADAPLQAEVADARARLARVTSP